MSRELVGKIWALLDPVVAQQGYEIVEVEVHGNRRSLLRVFIDGPNGIGLDKCAEFSRAFSDLLDVEDPIKSAYDLEVSSPGLDRPLRKPAHFKKAVGEEVQLRVMSADGRPKKLRGKLTDANEEQIVVTPPRDTPRQVKISDVFSANVVYDFSKRAP